jgi:hypothetical protein
MDQLEVETMELPEEQETLRDQVQDYLWTMADDQDEEIWRIQELQFSKRIKIKEPKRFEGRPGEDLDTWWIMVNIFFRDQSKKFQENERTIIWIRSLMDKYATAWHI